MLDYGDGYGHGYGGGNIYGCGYGHGYGNGYVEGDGVDIGAVPSANRLSRLAVSMLTPWPYVKVGCQVHILEHWRGTGLISL